MKNNAIASPARFITLFFVLNILLTGCQFPPAANAAAIAGSTIKDSTETNKRMVKTIPDAAVITGRIQVPILCYHQIRDWRATDSKQAKDYIVPVTAFNQQLKMLADSGYHTISADQLYDYLITGAVLPNKPVMLTFDDTDLPQYTIARPAMEKYGFKGLYFIMTVSLGRPNYMSRQQVKELAEAGNEIGSHTWDHKNIKKFMAADWTTQIDKPTHTLEAITGRPIKYFAYPFGLWNDAAIPQLKAHGFRAAFQLSAKRNTAEPLYTIRRMIVPGAWTAADLQTWMKHNF